MAALIFLLLFLFVGIAEAQPTASAGCIGHVSGATSMSVPCTIPAGSNRAVALGVGLNNPAANITNVLFGGSATSIVGTAAATNLEATLYFQVNPATGSQNFTFDVDAFPNASGAVVPLAGVNQLTPIDTAATATGTNATPSVVVSSATGDLVIDMALLGFTDCGDGSMDVGAGQTSQTTEMNGDWGPTTMSTEAGASTVTMSHVCTGGEQWATIGVSINPVASSGRRRGTVFFD